MVILTLWIVIFLSLLSMAVATYVSAHLKAVTDMKWSAYSDAVGMHAVALSVDLIRNDTTETCDTLHDNWADSADRFSNVSYAGGTFSVSGASGDSATGRYGLSDEEGKVSLNRAPASQLSLLFQAVGHPQAQADELAVFLVDWRDPDSDLAGGMGAEACSTLAVPSLCKNADFESVEELWWMPGMTSPLYNALRDEVTLYGNGIVNANTATHLALRSLGLSDDGAGRVISWRSDPGRFFDNASAIIGHREEMGLSEEDSVKLGSAASTGLLGTRSDYYRGEVFATLGNQTRKTASFVIDRMGKVRRWRE